MANVALYWVLRAAARMARFVPVAVMYALADVAGTCAYCVVGSARRGILSNLAIAVPDRPEHERRRLARGCFRTDARNWVDTLRIPHVTRQDIERGLRTEGREHLEAAVAAGKGAICVTMHLGNYDLVGQMLQFWGYQLTIPVERMEPARLFDFLVGLRASRAINIVPVERAPREMLRALRRGELAGVAGDRDVTGQGVVVPFFGHPTRLPSGPAVLARHTGAPVLVTVGMRRRGGGYEGHIPPQVEMQRTGDDAADDPENTARIARVLEEFICRYPDQWLAFSPIWEGRVAGSDPATMRQQREAAV